MGVDYTAGAISARLREQARRSDLRPARRLHGKLDMTAEAVLRRLRRASRLREACLRWGKARPLVGSAFGGHESASGA